MSNVSIAIETTCREGGLCLAIDGELKSTIVFNAAMRHASQLVSRMDEMLQSQNLTPRDINEVYVSAGPGSFTGVRLGMTVARTLGFLLEGVKFVSVPTARAIAQSQADSEAGDIAVVLDGKDDQVFCGRFENQNHIITPAGTEGVVDAREFVNSLPAGTVVIGEAVDYCKSQRKDLKLIGAPQGYPKAENVWAVGQQMSIRGEFTELTTLLPVYSRKPEAVRLWEKRNGENSQVNA